MFSRLLDLKAVFPQGIRITCTTRTDLYIAAIRRGGRRAGAPPPAGKPEQLARTIHENYNRTQLEATPSSPWPIPPGRSCPTILVIQHPSGPRAMSDKLTACGYAVGEPGGETRSPASPPSRLNPCPGRARQLVRRAPPERLVLRPREGRGAQAQPLYDTLRRTHREIKELDRDAVRNVSAIHSTEWRFTTPADHRE